MVEEPMSEPCTKSKCPGKLTLQAERHRFQNAVILTSEARGPVLPGAVGLPSLLTLSRRRISDEFSVDFHKLKRHF
jgi:hypothetical protein